MREPGKITVLIAALVVAAVPFAMLCGFGVDNDDNRVEMDSPAWNDDSYSYSPPETVVTPEPSVLSIMVVAGLTLVSVGRKLR